MSDEEPVIYQGGMPIGTYDKVLELQKAGPTPNRLKDIVAREKHVSQERMAIAELNDPRVDELIREHLELEKAEAKRKKRIIRIVTHAVFDANGRRRPSNEKAWSDKDTTVGDLVKEIIEEDGVDPSWVAEGDLTATLVHTYRGYKAVMKMQAPEKKSLRRGGFDDKHREFVKDAKQKADTGAWTLENTNMLLPITEDRTGKIILREDREYQQISRNLKVFGNGRIPTGL